MGTVRPTIPAAAPGFATNQQPLLGDYDADILQMGHWEQEVLLGTNGTDLVSGVGCDYVGASARNLLSNAGFADWNAIGVGVPQTIPANISQRIADGWFASNVQNCIRFAQITADTTENGVWFVEGAFGASGYVAQLLYDVAEYRGRTLTLRARGFGGTFYAALTDDGGGVGVPLDGYADGAIAWQTSIASMVVSNAASRVTAFIVAQAASPALSPHKFANPMLTCTNSVPIRYEPLQPAANDARERRRWLKVPFHCRFRAQASGEIQTFTLAFPPTVLVPQFVTAALYSTAGFLYSDTTGTVTSTNVDTNTANTLITDFDSTHITVQVAAVAAGDCQIRNGFVVLDTQI